MEKGKIILLEKLECAELRVETDDIGAQSPEMTEKTRYRVKGECYPYELAQAIASSIPDKWGWIVVSDDEAKLRKGLMENKAARHVHGKLEQDEMLRVFFRGQRVTKAYRVCGRNNREDWFLLADPLTEPEKYLLEDLSKELLPDPEYNQTWYIELETKGYIGTNTWRGLPYQAWLTEKGKAYLETIKP